MRQHDQRSSASISGEKRGLVDHPHVGPVILELMAAIEADDVVPAGRGGHIPVSVGGAPHGDRSRRGKGLGELPMRTANREKLENLVDHSNSREPISGRSRKEMRPEKGEKQEIKRLRLPDAARPQLRCLWRYR